MSSFPKISLRELGEPQHRPNLKILSALGTALEKYGCFALTDHGVDMSLFDQAYEVGAKVFDLPQSEKKACISPVTQGLTGYLALGPEQVQLPGYKRMAAPNDKVEAIRTSAAELWHVGGHESLNLWPERYPDFKRVMLQIRAQLDACADKILEAASLHCSADSTLFTDLKKGGISTLRIMKYPPPPPELEERLILGDPHEDVSLITFFVEGNSGTLQVQTPEGKWEDLVPQGDEIFVGVGDMLMSLSNGLYRSATHRVQYTPRSGQCRISMPYLVAARPEVNLEPLAPCLAKSARRSGYPSLTVQELLIKSFKMNERTREA